MFPSHKLSKVLTGSMDRLLNRRSRPIPIEGIPSGVSFEMLNELCQKQWGKSLRRISYMHISSWKAAGSYRIFLETENGFKWSVIFKNAIYRLDHLPALAELPVNPGPSEFVVYKNARGPLTGYLPAIYLCSEVVPGKQYQYLLEDLGKEYQKSLDPEIILRIVPELPLIHRTLREWFSTISNSVLPNYDLKFSIGLLNYVRIHLEHYALKHCNKTAYDVCKILPDIAGFRDCYVFREKQILQPIHGDFNPSNVLTNGRHPAKLKLVDWEWAGLGMIHADLASLLARAPADIEQQALAIFSKQNSCCSFAEHKRLYQIHKLERHLLDAAFMAAQQVKSDTCNNFDRIIKASLNRARQAYQELIHG